MRPLSCFALALLLTMTAHAQALYDVPIKEINGKSGTMAVYKGQVLLIVNVASECGYTPQYAGLEALHREFKDKGLTVLGVPCNQFGSQEPGSNQEIQEFCTSAFSVTFPLLEKTEVNGARRHPLYAKLTSEPSPRPGNIQWNFTKFLVGRDGKVIARFEPDTEPQSPELLRAIGAALAAK
jgi:glutathione peroxidase